MPIVWNKNMPAYRILRDEGVELVRLDELAQRKSPVLRVALLNLMPEKATTEIQIARLLGESAHCVEVTYFVPDSYRSKTTPVAHMAAFYARWSQVRGRCFDGLIVTGAPIETLPFEDVSYWTELTAIFDWARKKVGQSYYICWAAQAALQHFHGVPKRALPAKMSGVFAHQILQPDAPLMRGLAEDFPVPVSRHTEVSAADLPGDRGLEILASSKQSGLCLMRDPARRAHYMFNHLEYDANTLAREYARDLCAGRSAILPRHYFPQDDPARTPAHSWRGSARILFRNWLNEVAREASPHVYERTTVDWLLGGGAAPAPVGVALCDFLIDVEDHLTAVPTVLRVLAGFSLAPVTLRVTKSSETRSAIYLRLTGIGGNLAERIARRVARAVQGVRRIGYRDTQGVGGVMVPKSGFGPEPPIRIGLRMPGRSAA